MNIGEQLQLMRKNAGLTQESVAEIMHITRQSLSNWERDINLPDIYTVIRLAAVYKISLDEVLLGKTFFKKGTAMKTNYSDAQIENLIKKHYPDAHTIQILSGGLVSQTFSFKSGGEKFIFQVGGKKEAYEKEHYISQQYKDILPVRHVHNIYVNNDGCAYCFSDYIEGCKLFDLNPQELIDTIPSILELFDKFKAIDIPENSGYGRFDATGSARFDSWQEYISSIYDKRLYNWDKLKSKKFDIHIIEKAISILQNHICDLDIRHPRLIHGDIGSYNLLADGGKAQVSGAIDWSFSLYGDPLYETANILFWNEAKLKPLITELKSRYLTNALTQKRVYCYIIHIGLYEIYNTVVLDEIGYDVLWVTERLKEIVEHF